MSSIAEAMRNAMDAEKVTMLSMATHVLLVILISFVAITLNPPVNINTSITIPGIIMHTLVTWTSR